MNVFPIKAGEKFPPLVKNWPKMAKPREQWADVYGDCNWGVHCEGMIVVDVDVRGGGLESFEQLDNVMGWDPTYMVGTPTGGRHLYYKLPEGHLGVPNSAGKLAPGIDIKSTGGYVVGAGSKVAAGRYIANEHPIAPAPQWLIDALGVAAPVVEKPKTNIPDAPEDVVERAREWIKTRPVGDELFVTSCWLRDLGLSHGQAAMLVAEHDPRPLGVTMEKVRHAYEYAKGDAGAKVSTADDFDALPVPPPKPVGEVLTFDEMADEDYKPKGYLVKGLLDQESYAVIYGPPGAGKTFVALDVAHHVAAGSEWMGHRVKQGAVLYLAYEGMGGIRKRARALRERYGASGLPLYFHAANFNLRDQSGRKALGELIRTLPQTPTLIVIDTLARAMQGGDENSAQDMGLFNAAVQALIESTKACVLVIHHSGKNTDNGARGSSSLLGAIDTEIRIDDHQIEPTKQRDQEIIPPIGFELHAVEVGRDEDGDPIMSCWVEQAAVKAKEPKMKLRAARAWSVLTSLPHTIPRDEFRRIALSRDLTKQDVSDGLRFLEEEGYIRIVEDIIERLR